MGSDYGVPDADKLDRSITTYKRWLVPIQVRNVHYRSTHLGNVLLAKQAVTVAALLAKAQLGNVNLLL